ncbi:endonuclease/exonuclease/phosphatase family protein [Rubrivirga sp.]|uniref:endonuclease/exonuclease/phosphatase family protein n=1 Tax=Rubrivirga sp. TaxID=1885344 RepID=UPI003B527786
MPRLVLLIVFLAGCQSSRVAPEDAPATLRVVSANVRLDVASDGDDAWPLRRDAVARVLADADLVGVQEATPTILADLDARLPGFARIGVGRDADGGGEASAIYYRTDRLVLADDGTFWLSETPDVPGSQSWDAALPRIATWGRFRDRATGAELVHLNTHFDHVGEEARRQAARLIAARLPGLADGGAAVVTGDLNATPDSEPVTTLVDGLGLDDARLASATPAEGPARTWNGFGQATDDRRIDYVFVLSPARVLAFRTIDATIGDVMGTDNGRELSDHYFVEATVAPE